MNNNTSNTVQGRGRDFGVAISRAFDVLGCFISTNHQLGLTEIARNAGLPKTTAFRIVFTLEELGYLIRMPDTRKYRLAWGLLPLSYPLLSEMPIRQTVRPMMQNLAARFKVNVNLATLHRFSVIFIESVRHDESHVTRPDIGAVRPLFVGAIGPAVFCGLPQSERTALLNRVKLAHPDQYDECFRTVKDAQNSLKKDGYIFSAGDYVRGLHSLAAPMPPGSFEIPLAFNCVFTGPSKVEERKESIAPELVGLVRQFERKLSTS